MGVICDLVWMWRMVRGGRVSGCVGFSECISGCEWGVSGCGCRSGRGRESGNWCVSMCVRCCQ